MRTWRQFTEWRPVRRNQAVKRNAERFPEDFLIINTHIARILPLQIFHLLGLRRRRWIDNYLVVSRRAYDLAGPTKLIL